VVRDNVMLGRMNSFDSTGERRSQLDFLTHMRDTLAAGIIELPAFPQVVIKVQEAYKDPNYTPQLVALMDELWSDSATVAHFSQAVAKRASLPTPEAFVAGLLLRAGVVSTVKQ
jgi:HD-like signal output (HDOD) protein